MKNLTVSDKNTLIKLASSLPAGDPSRKAILAGLKTAGYWSDYKHGGYSIQIKGLSAAVSWQSSGDYEVKLNGALIGKITPKMDMNAANVLAEGKLLIAEYLVMLSKVVRKD